MNLPDKKIKVIECESMDFVGKDIINIKKWEDFIWLIQDDKAIYKLKNCYYIISNEVAWLFKDNSK